MSRAYTLLFDDYADWELGHILAEIRRFSKIDVVTVGFSDKPVTSMGGLRVIPDKTISQVDIEDVLIFIIPGGYLWEGDYPRDVIDPFLHRLEEAKIPVAAICAGTITLANAGLLKNRKHTSNSPSYLSKINPEYSAKANYVEALATKDQHIITASGLGSIEFTMEIFDELGLVTPEMMKTWYDAFKNGIYPEEIPTDINHD
ncbi:MAG: thiamine biosynthesis protein ThiJ [Desulfobacteraceae bacterium]|nr:thiamine biosynthesis protein ThiJ [Desulfobacteraceae bacterium]